MLKKAPKGFENTTREILGPLYFKQLIQKPDAQDDTNGTSGVTAQIRGDTVKLGAS